METLFIMLKNVIIFVLLAVPGYLLVKGKKLGQAESGTLSKLLTNIGMPFLILSSALKLEFSGDFTLSLVLVGVLVLCVVPFSASYIAARIKNKTFKYNSNSGKTDKPSTPKKSSLSKH